MINVNAYDRQLTAEEIAQNVHRDFVGGAWDEIGLLQLDFLKKQGLQPTHTLLDVGCGALRGGLHFISYLDVTNYYGMDINQSLITAAHVEIAEHKLSHKKPQLWVTDKFELSICHQQFDYAIAVSVFTHLFANHIIRCLVEVAKVLKPEGKFFASFFEAPESRYLAPLHHPLWGFVTHFDQDPFHYSFSEIQAITQDTGLEVSLVGDWQHPRGQRMLCFQKIC